MTKEEKNAKSREYMSAYRKTDAYRIWLEKSRENRRRLKEKYRRQAGSVPKEVIVKRAAERAMNKDDVRRAKAEFIANFVGPPSPSRSWLGDSRYKKFRYQFAHVREEQIKKRHRYVQCVTAAYAKERLGMKDPPTELIEAMREKLLIERDIRSLTNVIKEVGNA